LWAVERLGGTLIREGFRQYIHEQNFKISGIIKSCFVLNKLVESETTEDDLEREWITRSIKFIVMGVSDPVKFLWELHDKFEKITETEIRKDLKSYKIVNKVKIQQLEKQRALKVILQKPVVSWKHQVNSMWLKHTI
jgi:hypothetical protein